MRFHECIPTPRPSSRFSCYVYSFANQLKGVELSQEELSAEQMAQEFAAPHVNFYDPVMFRDLQAEVRFFLIPILFIFSFYSKKKQREATALR